MRFLLPFIVLLMLIPTAPARAEGYIHASVTAVKLYRGATILVSSDPNATTYRANFTPEACEIEKRARWEAEGRTKTSGTEVQYKCQVEKRDTIRFRQPAACPQPPPDQTRPGECPTGTQGSWTQTGTTTFGPAPTCAPTITWRPLIPPEGACTPIPPPPLVAPTGVSATADSTSVITVRWNVVPDALSYQVKRCIVPSGATTCTELSNLICARALTQSHVTLPPGTTVRYQVAASRGTDCQTPLGADSAIVQATTLTSTTPPPTASSCVGRTCTLRWTYSGPAAEGFRVVYGRSTSTLPGSKQFVGGDLTAGEVTVTEAGVWYFAVITYGGGNDSPLSNIISLTVQ